MLKDQWGPIKMTQKVTLKRFIQSKWKQLKHQKV